MNYMEQKRRKELEQAVANVIGMVIMFLIVACGWVIIALGG